jgi:hypothetical protein
VNVQEWNLRLAQGSAAVDAGVDSGIHEDLDGNRRPLGRGYDIGAYERLPAWLWLPMVRR